MNKINYGGDGRNLLKEGVEALAKAVKVTLGACGRNVAIRTIQDEQPRITKDGVTVAKAITLPHKVKNMGARMVKDVAIKTARDAGDGTTTATVLAESIIVQGMDAIDNGSNPMDLKKGMEAATKEVIQFINENKKEIKLDSEDLDKIAIVSANGDEETGKIIAESMRMVGGIDGVVIVEKGMQYKTQVELIPGYQFDSGLINPLFINKPEKLKTEFLKPFIFFYAKTLSSMRDILPLLEKVHRLIPVGETSPRPLLLICEGLIDEAFETLVKNTYHGKIKFAAVTLPEIGMKRIQMINDLAELTGTKFYTQEMNKSIETIKAEDLGTCEKVIIDMEKTILVGLNSNKEKVASISEVIKSKIASCEDENEKSFLKSHLARVNNGVAILKIGGYSLAEVEEKYDRIDDALCATRSALEEGVIPGGGSAYIKAVDKLIMITHPNKDFEKGYNIIKKAISAPFHQILENAGLKEEQRNVIYGDILSGAYGRGYNVKTDKVENFLETGILDPAKVARVALESASSIGSIFITTECVISPFTPKGTTRR